MTTATQSGITATPNPQSAFWFETGSRSVASAECFMPSVVVLSPTRVLEAYLTAAQPVPLRIGVEHHGRQLNQAQWPHMSTAKAITKAHEDSGLTWEQLGKVFGVSRRSVHMWATGGRVNATNTERLMSFIDLLGQIEGDSDDRRAALLMIGPDGLSLLDRFRAVYLDARADNAPRPESLLAALHGDFKVE